ncbi:MAG TPA: TerY-C metal binding domain-containing protein, partial [Chitinophaga sp.]
IATDELTGFPACPSCGNQYGFSVCSCGHIHCIGQEQTNTCPWCGQTGDYGIGGGNMNLNRSQG